MPDPDSQVVDVLAVDATVQRSTGAEGYGVTRDGFVPKSFARLLSEKLSLAQALLGVDLDLTSGSVIRKLLEVTALEDARTWAALAAAFDDSFVGTATGDSLSRLGEELGLQRPELEARGTVTLAVSGELEEGSTLVIPRGARMVTPGGHDVATAERVSFSAESPSHDVAVVAFHPGPGHNLDPAQAGQKITAWNEQDGSLAELFARREAAAAAGQAFDVTIEHQTPLTGGELLWPDERYRRLLLQAPRSIWTAQAILVAASLVPGVRQVQVHDAWGGLDISQSIFGNFNFIERLFASERDIGTPYYFKVLVAPTPSAIWDGPKGLRQSVEAAIQDLRPISIFPTVEQAEEVGVGVTATLVVSGLPVPSGTQQTVNASAAALALKERLLARVAAYFDSLSFGEPVRTAEVTWTLMSEPGVVDVRDLRLLRFPPSFDAISFVLSGTGAELVGCGDNIELEVDQIAVLIDDPQGLVIGP